MSKTSLLIYKEYIIISIIIIIAFTARLYKIDNPLADWHSWRQVDTSAVTRRYIKDGTDLLHPRYDDLSNIPSGLDNPQGYRFVEFPIINGLTAILFLNFKYFNLEIWGRLVSIFFSLGSIIFVYLIGKWYYNKLLGYLAAVVFALLPYNLYYHRTILPEVPLLFFSLAGFYYFINWLKKEKLKYFLISLISASIGVLIKPYILFLALPLAYEAFRKWKFKIFKQKHLYIYIVLVILPFLLWRNWASNFPEGIPAYTWLLNGSRIRFRPAFFRWIFAERISKLILGFWGLILLAFGLIEKPNKKTGWTLHLWLLSMTLYLFTFATGNVTHDYYQIIIVPPLAIFTALGIKFLLEAPRKYQLSKLICYLLIATSLLFMFGFSWFHVRDFFNINHPEIVQAGQIADLILPQDAKVVAPYQGDTAFLYQINRQGWPIGGDIKTKIEKGATDYVSVNQDDEAEFLQEHCQPTIDIEGVTIISLRNCNL